MTSSRRALKRRWKYENWLTGLGKRHGLETEGYASVLVIGFRPNRGENAERSFPIAILCTAVHWVFFDVS